MLSMVVEDQRSLGGLYAGKRLDALEDDSPQLLDCPSPHQQHRIVLTRHQREMPHGRLIRQRRPEDLPVILLQIEKDIGGSRKSGSPLINHRRVSAQDSGVTQPRDALIGIGPGEVKLSGDCGHRSACIHTQLMEYPVIDGVQ